MTDNPQKTPPGTAGSDETSALAESQVECSAPPAAAELSVFTSPTRLSKHIEMRGATPVKLPGGEMVSGTVEVKGVRSAQELAVLIRDLKPNQALAYGVPRSGVKRARITTLCDLERNPLSDAVARSGEHLGWRTGPGILMLDYDPPPGTEPLTEGEFYALAVAACPELADAPSVLLSSASSHIHDVVTDRTVIGAGGLRLLVFVLDASDILRAGRVQYDRLWLNGHGYFRISKAGIPLERTLIDSRVWGPERLDFVGGASCGPGLEQRRPPPIVRNNTAPPLDTRAALPDLTPEQRRALLALKEAARASKAGEAAKVRYAWAEGRLAARDEADREKPSGMTESEAREARDAARAALINAAETHVLHDEIEIHLADGRTVTVAEIKANPSAYHRLHCADPLEPDYRNDRRIARIYTESATPTIHSYAHGEQKYVLIDPRDPADDFDVLTDDPPADPAGARGRSREYRLVPARDLMGTRAPRSWLVKGLLERGVLAVLYGPSGSGKSFIAIDIAASIATGRDWFGHKVPPGLVVYLVGEGLSGVVRRLQALETDRQISLADAPLYVSNRPIKIDAQGAKELSRVIAGLPERPVLIVVDTLHRHYVGEENNNDHMGEFLDHAEGVARDVGATLLIVHHTGHTNTGRERGASALRAAVDTSLLVNMSEAGVISLSHIKAKDDELQAQMRFRLKRVPLPTRDEDGQQESSAVLLPDMGEEPKAPARRGANQSAIRAAMIEMSPDGAPVLLEALRAKVALDRRKWKGAVDGLRKQGLLKVEGKNVQLAGAWTPNYEFDPAW